jgi:transcriptional regulator with XRE-family HTH domain
MHSLRGLRSYAGYSLQDLSDATGIPSRTLSLIERERLIPSAKEKRRIAEVLGIGTEKVLWIDTIPDFDDYENDEEEFDENEGEWDEDIEDDVEEG